ncbi:Protein of unknown function [Gryllus bimaculatus]|nr:Protein of unknown function [Gryllus bimaculatus]
MSRALRDTAEHMRRELRGVAERVEQLAERVAAVERAQQRTNDILLHATKRHHTPCCQNFSAAGLLQIKARNVLKKILNESQFSTHTFIKKKYISDSTNFIKIIPKTKQLSKSCNNIKWLLKLIRDEMDQIEYSKS